MAKHEVWIPEWRPHSLNQLLNARSTYERYLMKNSDKLFVSGFSAQQRIPKAVGKRKVSLHIKLKGKQRQVDPGAYDKSLMDALVACGMLVDDNSKFLEVGEYTYERNPNWGTTIILEDV